jgi:hypothetical protein
MGDGYNSTYSTEDGSEAGVDFLVTFLIVGAGLAGLIGLVLVLNLVASQIKRAMRG